MKAHVVLHFVRMASDDCGRVDVCSKREISFYKWTDGFGMLMCAQKTSTVEWKGKENERNTNSWRIKANVECVTPVCCAQHVFVYQCTHIVGVGYEAVWKREWRGKGPKKKQNV